MDETFLPRFERLIADHIGLQLRPHEREMLRTTVAARVAALRLRHTDEYHRLLQSGTREAASEWEQIIALLTNQESYFFRDKGQIALLRDHILPELIQQNQARRTLRLWSAGCSTGEEPYSLAMLVDELLPERGPASRTGWEIVILGTDIDEQALQKARRALYSSWSFRTTQPALRERWFQRQGTYWQVAEPGRSLVTFGRCNLVRDRFPDTASGLYEMDLILCRNVFIYFERDAVTTVLSKFAQTLRAGGYLMTGHAETYGQPPALMQARIFPGSVVYQRTDARSAGATLPPAVSTSPIGVTNFGAGAAQGRTSPVKKTGVPSAGAENSPRPTSGRAPERASARSETAPIAGADRAQPVQPSEAVTRLQQAFTSANTGQYEEATECCQRIIKEHPFASEPYELLASIAQVQGRYDEAKMLLKKALYLAPSAPSAYLELGAIYQSEGDTARAGKMFATARELLQNMDPDAAVGAFGGPTVQEWLLHLSDSPAEGE